MFLSRKRRHSATAAAASNSSVPPSAQPPNPKIPKSTTRTANPQNYQPENDSISPSAPDDQFISVLADAGCTLISPAGPPCLPSDLHKLRHRLHRRFSNDSSLRSGFLHGLFSYVTSSHNNLLRVLLPSHCESTGSVRSESLIRVLLLVESIQLDVQNILLEKLPEYFDMDPGDGTFGSLSLRLEEDVARLILNQLRWLDFLADSQVFTENLLQVLSICPLHLKKEIIGSLPEIIGDQSNKVVVNSLQQMLQEDSSIIVPVLDTFSNLNLDDLLQDEVVAIALSCIRTVDVEHMPYLLRFLLLSATPTNARRIVSEIREQLKFVGLSNVQAMQHSKLKGKLVVDNAEASILNALKSSLQFKNTLCQEILKELKSLEKVRDHKVIDIWLLILIYTNCESLQKSVQKLLRQKIVEGCIEEAMFALCIHGNKDLAQDYLLTFLCMSEYLLACKEKRATAFGIYVYQCLFKEFHDTYSRQEVLGALVSHVGSGISHEVSAALETMVQLASKYPQELIRYSSHITGILDYLESFSLESLHKVYEVFSLLALSARSSGEQFGSSISNELMIIVRKQVSNPDLAYKRMGLIGMLKIVSYLGDATNNSSSLQSQNSNCEEALELLKTSFDSCKQLTLSLILFHEELAALVQNKMLHPAIIEWIGKHVGEFESTFLTDLNGGELPVKDSHCGLEGELWMNLDGDISPVCLNILPHVSSSLRSTSPIQVLPVYFVLLSMIERVTNQGSLGGIDALLGCPLHLPSSKYLSDLTWQSLSDKHKQVIILCLYYAINWIRELLNAFSTQVAENCDSISQATKEEIILKLMRRLRNLVFLECLLNEALKKYPLSLPEVCFRMKPLFSSQYNHTADREKKSELAQKTIGISQKSKRNNRKASNASENSDIDGKLKQPTIMDIWRKAGAVASQEMLNADSSARVHTADTSEASEKHATESDILPTVEISAGANLVEAQRYKFRPLLFTCFSILAFTKNQYSCCTDPAAELPLHLYLLRDLHRKLELFSPPSKLISTRYLNSPPAFSEKKAVEFLSKIHPLFPSLKRHFDCSIYSLKGGSETCQDHWKKQSILARNLDVANMIICNSSVCCSVFRETLGCFGKMINIPGILDDKSAFSDLLDTFQPIKVPECFFHGVQLIPSPGSIDYLYCGAYCFLEEVLDTAITLSFNLASEVILALESVVISIQKFHDKSASETAKDVHSGFTKDLVHFLRNRLGASAQKLLLQKYDDMISNSLKIKGEIVQKILHIYLKNNKCTSDSLNELACSILPQVTSRTTRAEDESHVFPTLCPTTLLVWCRVMHEENLAIINNLVKEASRLVKPQAGAKDENSEKLLNKLQKSVNVVVSLVNMCRTHNKVSLHTMAVKYGGKFVDSFLKVFDFLQAQFDIHQSQIIEMVKELQKATRTIQTLCSEAKASKQTAITSKIPATKRSMERFLFHVKALLHTTSECTFWMGNLKHKDLMGQVVSSQAYLDDQSETAEVHHSESIVEN